MPVISTKVHQLERYGNQYPAISAYLKRDSKAYWLKLVAIPGTAYLQTVELGRPLRQ
jgi:hypothetical protein